jgi:four helix bundle protein
MVIRDIEDMPVMRVARMLEQEVMEILRRHARQMGRDLEDQLQRALNSIILNIAEGAMHTSGGQKARFYSLAKGSAGEVLGILTTLVARGIATAPYLAQKPRPITSPKYLAQVPRPITSPDHLADNPLSPRS